MYECYCEGEPPEFCEVSNVKAARAEHVCEECRRRILRGEPYEYTRGKWEGYFSVFHVCADCVALRQWAVASVPCFCWAFGNLHEEVREMVREVAPDVPGFFFEYGRQMVNIRRKRAAQEMRKA